MYFLQPRNSALKYTSQATSYIGSLADMFEDTHCSIAQEDRELGQPRFITGRVKTIGITNKAKSWIFSKNTNIDRMAVISTKKKRRHKYTSLGIKLRCNYMQ